MRLWLGFWSALLVGAIGWALVILFAGSRWIGVGISVPCLVVALGCGWLWWRARRDGTRANSVGERAQFERRARVHAALQIGLRTLYAGLGPVAAGRARRLPWYVVLGEPASGKSAALAAAGFDRVAREPATEAASMIQLWCSKEAVCWEVAGAMPDALGGHAPWTETLDALRRARPRQPLDGILVAVSAERLLAEERPGLEASARRLRQRLDELAERLDVLLPAYLCVTNIDALPDFDAFWGAAETERRSRPWGATWTEWDGPPSQCRSALARELGMLGSSLHAQALAQLCDRGASDPAATLRFPRRFSGLTRRLVAFAEALGEDAPLRPRLHLRGLYLCAAGRGTTGERGRLQAFVADLFGRGIVPDRSLARRSQRWWRAQRRFDGALLCGVLAAALVAVLPALVSYRQNLELIQATRQDVRAAAQTASAPVPPGTVLDRLLARLEGLEADADRFHVNVWWGAYEAPRLREAFAPLYIERLRATLTGPIRAQLAATLRAVSDVPALDWPGYRSAHDGLKLYLMLAAPERLDVPWASAQLLEVWERARQRGAYVGTGPLEPHVSRALAEVQRSSLPLWTPDPELVRTLREHLLGLPVGELESAWLEHAADGVPPIRAEQIFTGASARHWQARGEVQVPGTYTRTAWEKIRHMLDAEPPPPLDAWVFGEPTSPMWGAEQLRSAYLERYARAWMDFLLQLRSQPPQNLEEAVDQLQSFSEAEGPITRLFQRLSENLRIELRAPDELADRALAAAKTVADPALPGAAKAVLVASLEPARVAPLEPRFRGLLAFGFGDTRGGSVPPTAPLAEYQNQLRLLLGGLKDRGDRAPEADSESAALLEHAEIEVERLLAPLSRNERAAIEDLLLTPIRGSLASARDRDATRLAERWRSNVFVPEQALLNAYPFEPSSTEDATSAELARFFAAKTGTLWKFVDSELSSRVTDVSGHFAGRGAQGARLSEAFLRCLDVAREMRDAWFGGEGTTPKVRFSVRLLPVEGARAEVTLSVDGEAVSSAQNADRWQPLEWSGAGPGPGAVIQIKGPGFTDEIRRMGSFGLMRLLREGAIRPARAGGEQMLEVTWQLNHRLTDVTVQFRPEAALAAFAPELFQRLRCPASPF